MSELERSVRGADAGESLSIAMVCFASFGGSGVVATELAAGLAERGHRVHVIASAAPSRALPKCDRLFFHEVSCAAHPPLEHVPYTLPLAATIREVACDHGVDVVHAHYALPHSVSAYLAGQMLGERAPAVVTTLHGTDVTRLGVDPSYGPVTRFAVEASDGVTVPSHHLRAEAYRQLSLDPHRAIEVIHNFVDTERFAPAAERDPRRFDEAFAAIGAGGDATAERTLFHVSNFRAVKRVMDLFEVLLQVRRHFSARLVLVGDGPERAAAAARVRELGLQKHVCFLGKRADFAVYLRHADAFVFPSESESFGLAALEALSCGVPVFGYQIGGLPEVVTPDVGRLVAPFDVQALSAAVVDVLASPEARATLGEAARTRALTHFRREPAVERYERFYFRISKQRRGAGCT